jgi:hypothetical protein
LELLAHIRPDTPDPDAPEDMPEGDAPEFPEFEAGDDEAAAADETAAANTVTVDRDGWQTYELDDLYGNDEDAVEPEPEYEQYEQEYEEPEPEYEPEPEPEPEYYDDGRLTARTKGKGRAPLARPSRSRR